MVKDELNITVGARIRTIRENMGYTRERFSDLCDISDSFLSDVERGNKSLTTKTLYKICSSTNASADYILLGKSETSASQKSKRDQESLDMIAFYLQSLNTKLQKQETGRSPSVPVSYFCMIKSFYLSPFSTRSIRKYCNILTIFRIVFVKNRS